MNLKLLNVVTVTRSLFASRYTWDKDHFELHKLNCKSSICFGKRLRICNKVLIKAVVVAGEVIWMYEEDKNSL